ncbi:MAG: phosphoribosyltransferase [Blastocatellia bacterium]
MKFRDRREAGRVLARRLAEYAGREDVIILALPRGGVPVGYEVARALRAPLDVFVVRKLGAPGNEELAMGAIASGGARAMNEDVVRYLNISDETIDAVASREQAEVRRRERAYRGTRPRVEVAGRTVILVDDGLATGATMRAAVKALSAQKPAQIIVAAPVASPATCEMIERGAGTRCLCEQEPESLLAIGFWYDDFRQVTDEEVRDLLAGQPGSGETSHGPAPAAG